MQTTSLKPEAATVAEMDALTRFLAAPASCRPLAIFRIGVAAVLLLQALALMGALLALYGENGLVGWSVSAAMGQPSAPRLSWLAAALAPLSISATACVQGAFLTYVAALAALLIGWQTRVAAVLACLLHLMLVSTAQASIYGVDMFAQIALFYCVCMPVGQALSADAWSRGQTDRPSFAARLGLRVLQIHLCIVYLTSGIDKAEGIQWWNGEAIWRGLMRPDLNQFDVTWLAGMPWVAMVLCWGTLVVELGYPVFVWSKRTRVLWVLATIGLHVGIGVAMGLWFFSGIMIVLTGSAFLVSAEPREEKKTVEPVANKARTKLDRTIRASNRETVVEVA
jgi:hypothetical protein